MIDQKKKQEIMLR